MIRAKYKCTEKFERTYSYDIILLPTCTSTKDLENTQFSDFTPTGELELGRVKKEIFDKFKIGKEYYIDIQEVKQ